jgi:hypothetical protein
VSIECQHIYKEQKTKVTYSERDNIERRDNSHRTPDQKILSSADHTAKDIVTEAADAHLESPIGC